MPLQMPTERSKVQTVGQAEPLSVPTHTTSKRHLALVTPTVSGSLPTSPCLILTATQGRCSHDAHCTDEEWELREVEFLPEVTCHIAGEQQS